MQPLSTHWADLAAAKIIRERGDQETYVVASGVTPSGLVHVGNFRESITVDLVGRALQAAGKQVRAIHSWDDFDTFRKVPKNLPQQDMLKEQLRRPISRIPDPYGEEASYAARSTKQFEGELARLGVRPEYLYQEERYSSGRYAEQMRRALEEREKIKTLLNRYRTEPLAEDWLPTSIYCEVCQRDEMTYQRYDGDWSYSYECNRCQHQGTVDIRTTKNLKLMWRIDWPMRWAYEVSTLSQAARIIQAKEVLSIRRSLLSKRYGRKRLLTTCSTTL